MMRLAISSRFVRNTNSPIFFPKNLVCILLQSDTTMFSFSTRLHEDTTTSDSPIIFGTVDLNVGGGYDEFSGISYRTHPEHNFHFPYLFYVLFLPPATKCVKNSVHIREQYILGDMGNKRAVRVLLECILVHKYCLLPSNTQPSFHKSTTLAIYSVNIGTRCLITQKQKIPVTKCCPQ